MKQKNINFAIRLFFYLLIYRFTEKETLLWNQGKGKHAPTQVSAKANLRGTHTLIHVLKKGKTMKLIDSVSELICHTDIPGIWKYTQWGSADMIVQKWSLENFVQSRIKPQGIIQKFSYPIFLHNSTWCGIFLRSWWAPIKKYFIPNSLDFQLHSCLYHRCLKFKSRNTWLSKICKFISHFKKYWKELALYLSDDKI